MEKGEIKTGIIRERKEGKRKEINYRERIKDKIKKTYKIQT